MKIKKTCLPIAQDQLLQIMTKIILNKVETWKMLLFPRKERQLSSQNAQIFDASKEKGAVYMFFSFCMLEVLCSLECNCSPETSEKNIMEFYLRTQVSQTWAITISDCCDAPDV